MARRPITPFAALPVAPHTHSAPQHAGPAVDTHLPADTLTPAALPVTVSVELPPSTMPTHTVPDDNRGNASTEAPTETLTETLTETTAPTTGLPHGIAPDNLAALPRGCGVYVFRGEGALPLYIGKSVDLRARVLSHLRNADEAAMLAQSRRVDIYRTAGEIGALLLEAQWVKQHMPLYNIRLRRSRSLVAWRLSPDGANAGQPPQLVDSARHDFAHTSDLYGLYASCRAAQEDLRALAAEHRLCLVALGLEKPLRRGCFGRQLRQCDGVCTGDEPTATHHARLFSALLAQQVQRWPYPGAVDIIERDGDWVQAHRVHNWCYLGSHTRQGQAPDAPHAMVTAPPNWATPTPAHAHAHAHAQEQEQASAPGSILSVASATSARFDVDTYKILVKPLLSGSADVQALG